MIWFLRDIDLLTVLIRAATLSLEALLLGGVAFLTFVALPARAANPVTDFCRRAIRIVAVFMAGAEIAGAAASCADLLSGGVHLSLRDLAATDFVRADAVALFVVLGIWACARSGKRRAMAFMLPLGFLLLAAAVSTSHSVSRIDHRAFLAFLTGAHHLGTAAWIGAMPFLLISLARAESVDEARRLARRYSRMALAGAAALVLAGVGLAWFYIGSWQGLYGTTYGVLLMAKIYLLLVLVVLGAGNWFLVRRLESDPEPLLRRLRRVAEVEIGLGFIAILAAASLTAQPPAVDVAPQDKLTGHEIYARMHPRLPSMRTPPASALTPATPMTVAIQASEYQGMADSDANDRAWSDYNHNWAGLVVLAAGLLALLSRIRAMRWARFWPLTFAGLAVFILLRADPENWPLGPRPFWESFSAPDVLQHRFAALLILLFAAFECAVQAGKLRGRIATLVFPVMCVVGSAVLLTHDHAVNDVKEELFAAMSHIPIALFGATAGWARWFELRSPPGRMAKTAGYLWPACLIVVGLILLNYREIS